MNKHFSCLCYMQKLYNCASVLVHVTDRVIDLGLAPEIPEDLYMLIKKVCYPPILGVAIGGCTNLFGSRPSPSENILSETERTRTASSDSFLSSQESTVSADTTRLLVFSSRHGSTRALPPAPWSHKRLSFYMKDSEEPIT